MPTTNEERTHLAARLRELADAIASTPLWFDDRTLVVLAIETAAALAGAGCLGLARAERAARRVGGEALRG